MNSFKKEVQTLMGRNGVNHDKPTKFLRNIIHLRLVKSRKQLNVYVSDFARSYSGISFDDFDDEKHSGAILLHNIVGCEHLQEMKKAIESIIDKMEKSKGKKLIMIFQLK